MMQLVSFFQSQDYDITFASNCAKQDNAFDLSSIGIKKKTIALNDSSFDDFVTSLDPDVVLFDRFMTEEQFGWRVSAHCPQAIKILDTEDLHFLRRARHQALKHNLEVSTDHLFNDTAKREIASILRCDLSLIISLTEIDLLKRVFRINETLLLYLPFLLPDLSEANKAKLPIFEKRQHFMTIGNFLHKPNYDALLYLKKQIWSGIRKQLPNAELYNYGAYASEKVAQLNNDKDGFFIKGFADDVNHVMQEAKVLLAPIRFGAGLKGKLFDAMQNGLPFVSTPIGVEGIVHGKRHGFICVSAEDFILHAVTLYQDEAGSDKTRLPSLCLNRQCWSINSFSLC